MTTHNPGDTTVQVRRSWGAHELGNATTFHKLNMPRRNQHGSVRRNDGVLVHEMRHVLHSPFVLRKLNQLQHNVRRVAWMWNNLATAALIGLDRISQCMRVHIQNCCGRSSPGSRDHVVELVDLWAGTTHVITKIRRCGQFPRPLERLRIQRCLVGLVEFVEILATHRRGDLLHASADAMAIVRIILLLLLIRLQNTQASL